MARNKSRKSVATLGTPGVPFNPMSSQHEDLDPQGIYPYCAMLQIAEEDKYTDYVMCRGFDTRMRRFVDYEEGNSDKPGIAVAKPYGNRVKCYYHKWSVYPCLLPTQQGSDKVDDNFTPPSPSGINWRVGQNPGTAAVSCVGQTQALSDAITQLIDHNGKYVNWMLLDSGPLFIWVRLSGNLSTCGNAEAVVVEVDADGDWCDACDLTTFTVSDPYGTVPSSALAAGAIGSKYIPAGYNVLVQRVMSPGETTPPRDCQWAAVTFGSSECCGSPLSPPPGPLDPSPLSPSQQITSPLSPSQPSPSQQITSPLSPSQPSPSASPSLSASPSPSASSSPNPCQGGDCTYVWDNDLKFWDILTDTCTIQEGCVCEDAPTFPGTEPGQTVVVDCVESQ